MLPGKAGSLQPVPDSAYPSPLPFQDPSTSQRKSEGTDPSIDALYSGAAEAGSKAEQVVMNSAAPSSYPDPAPAFSTTSAFTATSPQPGRRKIEGTAGRRTSRSISRPGAQEEEEEEEEEEGGCCRRVPRANGEISGHNGCVEELRDPGLCNGRAQCVNGLGGPDTAQWGSLGHHGHRPLGCESSEDGQADGFLSRSSKHAGQSNSQHASQEQRGQEKVNPETVKTLPGGLEGPQRTRKRSKNTPKMSSNLEVALQEAMMELDQITANADQQSPKDKLRKPMKNKRRKIVR
ncbi:methyl-CpG-binding domain protein 5-like [Heptranchias perlo]|uniref:methyl-CpG-binding domain protein 5-like n=1 Tax=Heptranchias perlo TaxID=212740 RepID=UPI003559EFC8